MIKLLNANNLIIVSIMLIFIGIILLAFALIARGASGKARVAVGGFIGPFVFGFGNDPRMVRFAVIISLVAIIIFTIFLLLRI